ncbi:hypothetical protein F383_14321 [Gossypium arboreum]|uniref:Uncharacterized protein n=1 Tax=Gossypium arboreum TaxID=29729 RepID=A0A0B0PX98_GOSAR|nr:hypothetical protein F383_14321 [Gossypium arboreum]
MSQTCLTLAHKQMTQTSWHEYPIYFLRIQWNFHYLNYHYTFSISQPKNSCYINSIQFTWITKHT